MRRQPATTTNENRMAGGGASRRPPLTIKAIVCGLAALLIGAGCTVLDERRDSRPPFGGTGLTSSPADRTAGTPTSLTGLPQSEAATPDSGSALRGPELYRGTGQLVQPLVAPAPVAVSENGGVTLNFVDADIRDVVAAVLGETLGMNYEIDPRVQGSVTVRTAKPVPRDAVIPTLEEILAARGAALVRSDTLNRVLPLDAAAATISTAGFRTGGDRIDQGFGLYFFPLDFTFAQSLRTALEPFVPPGRVLRADDERNLLIFTGTSQEARDLESLIAAFDIDRMSGMSFGLYPVRFADLDSLIVELQTVFGAEREGLSAGVVRFLPIERLNAVLAVTSQPDYLDDIQTWITRLDRGEEGVGRRIYVYRVQNGRATDLADVLGQVFDSSGAAPSPAVDRLAPGLEPIELATDPGGEAIIIDESAETGSGTLGAGPPGAITITGDLGGGIPASGAATDVRIVADTRNNALLVWATPTEYRMILSTIRELDVIPLQTLIEATIVEVTLTDLLEYGLQWFFRSGDSSFTFSSTSSATPTPSFPGFSYVLSGTDVQVVLDALTSITDVKVISSPQLLVIDNEAARLQVGDEVPIAVQSSQSVTDPDAPLVSTIEYRDTGVILEVTPRVNSGGLVVLDILQEVSIVSESSADTFGNPIISQRRIESTVAVQGGETIALGGLIQDQRSDEVIGVPLLADIPLLGNLFKTTSERIDRTELLVLLTPRVVRDLQDARDVTQELRERLTGLEGIIDPDSEDEG